MLEGNGAEERYLRNIYHRIIWLAFAAHLSYIGIFGLLGIISLMLYNVASVIFYTLMQCAVRRGFYRLAVSCIHVEVCLFVLVSTLTAGWETGIVLYLVALASLTYFCPFAHSYIPYLFSLMEVCLFLALKLYTGFAYSCYQNIPKTTGLWLYIYNACACFTVILYAAFSSKVSAMVSKKQLQEEKRSLEALANYDQLTGFLNRRAFLNRLELVPISSLVLALCDIDDFKMVNDTWGHACGDQILMEASEHIRQWAGGKADVCRWGGEEFLILIRNQPFEEAVTRIEKLRRDISDHVFNWRGTALHITMTFGVCRGDENLTVEKFVELADKRMYEGKARGKNQVVF